METIYYGAYSNLDGMQEAVHAAIRECKANRLDASECKHEAGVTFILEVRREGTSLSFTTKRQ